LIKEAIPKGEKIATLTSIETSIRNRKSFIRDAVHERALPDELLTADCDVKSYAMFDIGSAVDLLLENPYVRAPIVLCKLL